FFCTAAPTGNRAAWTRTFDQKPRYLLLKKSHEQAATGTAGQMYARLYGAQTTAPVSITTGCAFRTTALRGHRRLRVQKNTTTATPIGKPTRVSAYWPQTPHIFRGPTVPQRTAAVKKVLMPGQVKRKGASCVQMPSIRAWYCSTPTPTRVETRVGTICAKKVKRGAILR